MYMLSANYESSFFGIGHTPGQSINDEKFSNITNPVVEKEFQKAYKLGLKVLGLYLLYANSIYLYTASQTF